MSSTERSGRSVLLTCFSPAVMLGTFVFEYIFALWALIRYRSTLFGQLAIIVLFLLGTFQVTEYAICVNGPDLLWAKIGLTAITLLPPLGLHLVSLLTRRSPGISLGYGFALGFIGLFSFVPNATSGATCAGNYVIVHIAAGVDSLYGGYYLGMLIWALLVAVFNYRHVHEASKKAALVWLSFGYLSFILPAGIVYLISEHTQSAVPSIMCGFALILAIILTWRVLPLYHIEEVRKRTT